jgi:hypothetical protein
VATFTTNPTRPQSGTCTIYTCANVAECKSAEVMSNVITYWFIDSFARGETVILPSGSVVTPPQLAEEFVYSRGDDV